MRNVLNMDSNLESIKKWIFLYFWLLIFEGALRKWILPQLATPLLLVRDPVVLMIYYKVYQRRLFPKGIWMESLLVIFIGSLAFTFITGHRNLEVAIFGVRANFMHIPLIFIMGRCMDFEDVEKIIRYVNWLIFPMTVLLIMQFYSPPTAKVNIGIGGVGTAGFAGALGKMRPPLVFSFISGTVMFYSLATVAALWGFFAQKKRFRWLMILNIFCIVLAVPMSISRSLLFSVLINLLFFCSGLLNSSRYRKYSGRIIIICSVAMFLLPYIPFLDEALNTFGARWDNAVGSSGDATEGTVGRFLEGFWHPLATIMDVPLLGLGLGMGTNAGAKLMTGEVTYLIAEGEWGRIIGEMGVFGLGLILYRVILSTVIIKKTWAMTNRGNILSWMLCGNCFLLIANGQWGQPTSQGFSMFSAGLAMASLNKIQGVKFRHR
jgi:hypothetical protein